MPDVPDLAALREKAEKARPEDGHWQMHRSDGRWFASVLVGSKHPDVIKFGTVTAERADVLAAYVAAVSPDVLLAVLSLVDDLRAALTYVGEFARAHHHQQPAHVLLHSLTIDIPEVVERALAGSPAANEACPSCNGVGVQGPPDPGPCHACDGSGSPDANETKEGGA